MSIFSDTPHQQKLRKLETLANTLQITQLLQERMESSGPINKAILERIKVLVQELGEKQIPPIGPITTV